VITSPPPTRSAVSLPLEDGYQLRGDWFPPAGRSRGAVLIVPAMATPAAYYHGFAAWLSRHRFAALTFDYRGFGASLTGSMRHADTDVLRWADDTRQVLGQLVRWSGDAPLTWLGHSLGGQILPFAEHGRIAQVITVGTGSGYWRLNSPGIRWRAPLLWHLVAPLSTLLWGYYPGSRFGVVGDLPAGVIRQWRRWCLHPDYLAGAEQAYADYSKVRTPIAALSFTDDEMMSAASIEALHRLFDSSNVVPHRYTPAQLGVRRMGHFGFFRDRHTDLWDELVLPILAARPT
jgi:predicted alpha/beta hydrolase